jgi:hypothetical protein
VDIGNDRTKGEAARIEDRRHAPNDREASGQSTASARRSRKKLAKISSQAGFTIDFSAMTLRLSKAQR